MPITLTESFRVEAPIERVWRYLIDLQQVARCLPGAEITEMESPRAFRGAIKVRVGPVTASFQGKAELTEVDESQYRVRITGSGRDAAGGNTATLRMTSTLRGVDGATEVRVESSVDLAGPPHAVRPRDGAGGVATDLCAVRGVRAVIDPDADDRTPRESGETGERGTSCAFVRYGRRFGGRSGGGA